MILAIDHHCTNKIVPLLPWVGSLRCVILWSYRSPANGTLQLIGRVVVKVVVRVVFKAGSHSEAAQTSTALSPRPAVLERVDVDHRQFVGRDLNDAPVSMRSREIVSLRRQADWRCIAGWMNRDSNAANFRVARPRHEMVVRHADGLHQRVADRGADKLEPAQQQILTHRVGYRRARRGVPHQTSPVHDGFATGELPEVGVEAAELLLHREAGFGVLDGRGDL